MFKTIAAAIGAVILVGVILFGLQSAGMMSQKFFGSWAESNRYEILKESQAHRDGLQRNLASMQTDYINADAAGKAAIAASVRSQYAQADTSEFPPHLKTFLTEVGVY